MDGEYEILWCVSILKTTGQGRAFIPATSYEHAKSMAEKWNGKDAQVDVWPRSPDLHAGMLKGLTRLFGDAGGFGLRP